mgnify:CR=1 FL=1
MVIGAWDTLKNSRIFFLLNSETKKKTKKKRKFPQEDAIRICVTKCAGVSLVVDYICT